MMRKFCASCNRTCDTEKVRSGKRVKVKCLDCGYVIGWKKNPPNRVKIYDTVIEIKAKKGKDSLWPNEYFVHKFKGKSKGVIYGNPDGSITIKSANGTPLWKEFDYD